MLLKFLMKHNSLFQFSSLGSVFNDERRSHIHVSVRFLFQWFPINRHNFMKLGMNIMLLECNSHLHAFEFRIIDNACMKT
jgi:hypothetical protein